jgi:hypothetical protein
MQQYEAAWQELRQRAGAGRAIAGGMVGAHAAAPAPATAGAEDNVLPYPARHDRQPGEVDRRQVPLGVEKSALERFVNEEIRRAEESRKWYVKNARSVKKWSRGSRTWAILLGVFGSLCHLFPTSLLTKVVTSAESAQMIAVAEITAAESYLGAFGLVFFMLAGSLLLYDQVFGFSTSWMRFTLAELTLDKLIASFKLDVEAELAKCASRVLPATHADRIFTMIKDFAAKVDKVKIEETERWIAEFKANGFVKIDQIRQAGGRSADPQDRGAASTQANSPVPLDQHDNRAGSGRSDPGPNRPAINADPPR